MHVLRDEPGPDRRRWLVLSVLAPPRGEEHLLVDALRRLGAEAVDREGERVLAWFPGMARVEDLLRGAEAAVRASTSLVDPGLSWRWEPHATWAARWAHGMLPQQVTDRIVVAPVGTQVDPGAEQILIRLDPAAAFGTAEHPSTRACLRLMERVVRPGDRVADIGTGSGILAIAAARLGADQVIALEAEADACAAARTNASLNGVAARVDVRHLLATPHRIEALGRFQGIAANLEANALRPLIPALAAALLEGGWLVLAGLLRPERAGVVAAMENEGMSLKAEEVEGGWWAGWLARTPCVPPPPGPHS
jgi:ribosomal protein L11 methyltransferase